MAQNNNNPKESSQYSRLIIYRKRQLSLGVLVCTSIAIFTVLIFHDLMIDKHWLWIAASLVPIGLGFILFPQTEEWEYRPWQNSPKKQEQYFYN